MTVVVIVLGAAPAGARRQVVERIIARVNANIVTQRQYDREIEKLRAELSQKYSGDELEKQVREQIFSQELSSMKDRDRILEEKFQAAKKKAEKDTRVYRNPLDLD